MRPRGLRRRLRAALAIPGCAVGLPFIQEDVYGAECGGPVVAQVFFPQGACLQWDEATWSSNACNETHWRRRFYADARCSQAVGRVEELRLACEGDARATFTCGVEVDEYVHVSDYADVACGSGHRLEAYYPSGRCARYDGDRSARQTCEEGGTRSRWLVYPTGDCSGAGVEDARFSYSAECHRAHDASADRSRRLVSNCRELGTAMAGANKDLPPRDAAASAGPAAGGFEVFSAACEQGSRAGVHLRLLVGLLLLGGSSWQGMP